MNIRSKIIYGLLLILVGTVLSMCSADKKSGSEIALDDIIPEEVAGFSKVGEVEKYSGEEIYRYMNGAGENYRMYDYVSMQVLRMGAEDGNEITVELFDMGDYRNAYGVFTHSREGEGVGVGEGSYARTGLLCFWQGKSFVCLSSIEETPRSQHAIQELSLMLTEQIPVSDKIPDIMSLLPDQNLIEETVRYFRNYTILNYHYFLAEENLFMIDSTTEAFLAQYEPDRTYLLCILYPSAAMAQNALNKFIDGYLTGADAEGFLKMSDDNWAAVEQNATCITAVFDSPNRERAEQLLSEIRSNINK